VRRLVQDRAQGLTFGLGKLGLHRLWSGRFLREAGDTFFFKRMNGVAHRLRHASEILGDGFGTLASARGQQNLTAAEGKDVR